MIGVSTHSKQVDFLSVSMHRKNIPVIGNENVSTLEKNSTTKGFAKSASSTSCSNNSETKHGQFTAP